MNFLSIFACTVLFCLLFSNCIRRVPVLFYALAVLLDVLLILNSVFDFPWSIRFLIIGLMQKGGLGVSLFVVVMYIGALPRYGKVSHMLRPIRAELSIMACILIAGHICVYLSRYVPNFVAYGISEGNIAASFVLSIALLVLMLILGITSFEFVKRHMKGHAWKKLQSLAYVFYTLVFAHLFLMIGPAALRGSLSAQVSVAVYAVIFALYVVARSCRAIVDKRKRIDPLSGIMDQGFKE